MLGKNEFVGLWDDLQVWKVKNVKLSFKHQFSFPFIIRKGDLNHTKVVSFLFAGHLYAI